MPSGFFCLCRFYLRVDATLVRVHDTRLYHRVGTGCLIRECTERESSAEELSGVSSIFFFRKLICFFFHKGKCAHSFMSVECEAGGQVNNAVLSWVMACSITEVMNCHCG